jgi:hypothetical protein
MTARAVLQHLHEHGVSLTPSPDGTVRCRALKGVLTSALVELMRQQKTELHALVEAFEERAAILEYDGRLPRDEAERLAWACIHSARDICAV